MTAAEKLLRGKIACSCGFCRDLKTALPQSAPRVPIYLVQNVWEYVVEQDEPFIRPEDAPGCLCPWREVVLTFEDSGGLQYAVLTGTGSSKDIIGQVFHSAPGVTSVEDAGQFKTTVDEVDEGTARGFVCSPKSSGKPEMDAWLKQMVTNAAGITTLSFAFANCRNVRSEKLQMSRQVRRHVQRTGEPVFERHVLLIDPMKETLRHEGGIEQHGLVKALPVWSRKTM